MKRRFISLALAAVLAASLLSGCKSTLRASIDKRTEQLTMAELTKEDMFSEESGYHYKNLTWGMDGTEANRVLYGNVKSISAYGDDGCTIYTVSATNALVDGRAADDANLGVTKNAQAYNFSVVFDTAKREEGSKTQKELFDSYAETLAGMFGEETLYEETEHEVTEDTKATYHTYYWDYTTADGKETELQWSSAYVTDPSEPSYVSLGFVWLNAEKE